MISLILAQPPAGTDYIAKVRAVEANKRLKEQLDRGEVTAPQVGWLDRLHGVECNAVRDLALGAR